MKKRFSLLMFVAILAMTVGSCLAAEGRPLNVPTVRADRTIQGQTETKFVQSDRIKVAVLPYINASEEKKGYVDDTLNQGYTTFFEKAGYDVILSQDAAAALYKTGYSTEDEELPDKDQMAEVAKTTGADFVVGMMVDELHASRHMSFFQAKVSSKTKLSYRVYAARTGKVYSFKSTSSDDNKTVFGNVGYKSPITNALNDAMEKGNAKVQGFIAENNHVEIEQ